MSLDLIAEVSSENFFEVIIIGGGTCGLAAAARLCEEHPGTLYTDDEHQRFHWLKQRKSSIKTVNSRRKDPIKSDKFVPQDLLIIDSTSSKFLKQWDNQFENCKIPFLRSPMFFHPDPANIDGLFTYFEANRRDKDSDLLKIENVVGKEYSKHKNKTAMKKNSKKSEKRYTHSRSGLVDVNMRDWRDYYRPSTQLFKKFCEDIVTRYDLSDRILQDEVLNVKYGNLHVVDKGYLGPGFCIKTRRNRILAGKVCIIANGHTGKINFPIKPFGEDLDIQKNCCHTSHIFSGKVQVPASCIKEKIDKREKSQVVVIGGGQTAAQIIDALIKEGVEKIYMITRDRMKVKHFDFHLDWVTKYRNVKKAEFFQQDTDEDRLAMIYDAREGGSVNPEYYRKLKNYEKEGRLQIMARSIITESYWDEQMRRWDIHVECHMTTNHRKLEVDKLQKTTLKDVDYVYFATGISQDIHCAPFLREIIENYRIPIVGGFPALTENLQWNDSIPLFMLGKNASLRVGPSSPNLDGARLGAERIGWYIQSMKERGQLDWEPNTVATDRSDKNTYSESGKSLSLRNESSLETRLNLATGKMNWFTLLEFQ